MMDPLESSPAVAWCQSSRAEGRSTSPLTVSATSGPCARFRKLNRSCLPTVHARPLSERESTGCVRRPWHRGGIPPAGRPPKVGRRTGTTPDRSPAPSEFVELVAVLRADRFEEAEVDVRAGPDVRPSTWRCSKSPAYGQRNAGHRRVQISLMYSPQLATCRKPISSLTAIIGPLLAAL